MKTMERNDSTGQHIYDSQKQRKKKSLWYECFYDPQTTHWNAVMSSSVVSDEGLSEVIGLWWCHSHHWGSYCTQAMELCICYFSVTEVFKCTIKVIYRRESFPELKVPQGESARAGERPRTESWEIMSSTNHKPEKELAVGRAFKLSKLISGNAIPPARLQLPIASLHRATAQRPSVQTLLPYMGR